MAIAGALFVYLADEVGLQFGHLQWLLTALMG
jgi:hypothetical protein